MAMKKRVRTKQAQRELAECVACLIESLKVASDGHRKVLTGTSADHKVEIERLRRFTAAKNENRRSAPCRSLRIPIYTFISCTTSSDDF
jgi:hypothetical protein